MKTTTARQHAKAYMSNTGPRVWDVVGKWKSSDATHTMYAGLTSRQAKASARAIREACGYAIAVKAA
jgi:hypothetical protein